MISLTALSKLWGLGAEMNKSVQNRSQYMQQQQENQMVMKVSSTGFGEPGNPLPTPA
jgi:hypothetical protein